MTEFIPHSDKQQTALLSDKKFTIAATGIQWGKGVPLCQRVLTENGYIPAKDIKLGDTLFDRDGNPTKAIGIYPQGQRDCYRVDLSDRKSFIVDDEHLNIIKRRGYAKEEIIKTVDLYNRKAIWQGRSRAQIPAVKPIKFAEVPHLISPYILGALLGNGSLINSIQLTSADQELLDRILWELPRCFVIGQTKSRKYDYLISSKIRQYNEKGHVFQSLIDELRALGVMGHHSYDKFIPDCYKFDSIENRVDLLRGLMDTDGTIANRATKIGRQIEFSSSSKALADDVIWLVESLGGKAWVNIKEKPFYRNKNGEKVICKTNYRVNIISPHFNPFYIKRKADKYFVHENTANKLIKHIEPVGKMDTICFKVDSPTETFIIEGQVVTHNTQCGVMRLKLAMHEFTDPSDNFLVTSPTYKILYQSTLPPFLALNEGCGVYDKKNEAFVIHGGGTVYFRTGKDPDSIIGITNVRHILCDEAGKYARYFWDNIQARAAFKNCPITIVTSPYSLNWLYSDFIRPYLAGDPYTVQKTCLIQAASIENPYFPKESWDIAKKKMDPRRFNMIFGGQFDRAEGLVYDCVDENIEVDPVHLPESTRIIAGIDWGYTDPFVIKVRAITTEGMHYSIAEHYRTQQRVTQMIETARAFMNLLSIEHFYADPSRPDLISEFCSAGIPTSAADNDIARGIEYHYALIKTGKYKIFRGTAPHSLDEYSTYHYPEPKDLMPDQKQRDMLPVDQGNHTMDAERYVTLASFTLGKHPNRVIRSDRDDKPKTIEEKIRRLKRQRQDVY